MIDCPPGTKLRAVGTFDNSADNPANPNPNKWVTFGEQTWDEMMIGYYDFIELDRMPRQSGSSGDPKPAEKPRKRKPVY